MPKHSGVEPYVSVSAGTLAKDGAAPARYIGIRQDEGRRGALWGMADEGVIGFGMGDERAEGAGGL